MCPHYQIIESDGGSEPELRTVDLPETVASDADRVATAIRIADERRMAERYGELAAHPTPEEGIVITEDTRKRLEAEQQEKAAVANVVTTHSDVAKMATGGGDVALVPTVAVYTQEKPLESDNKVEVQDNTVTLAGIAPGGSVLDRAETSLRQPKGDEYSAQSATGPTLPEGAVLNAIAEEEETEPSRDPEESDSEFRQRTAQEADEAAQKGAETALAEDKEKGFVPGAEPETASTSNQGTGTADSALGAQEAERQAEARRSAASTDSILLTDRADSGAGQKSAAKTSGQKSAAKSSGGKKSGGKK